MNILRASAQRLSSPALPADMISGAGIVQLDIHGMNRYQAKVAIDAALRRAKGVYRIRVIHGGNHNTVLRDMIAEEYAAHPLVLRIERGTNAGQSDLVLREL